VTRIEVRWECKVQNNAYSVHGDTKNRKRKPMA
jgi:hypothetical protein